MGRLVPASLFGRVLLTLVATFGVFAVGTLGLVVYFAIYPLAERSASDLAGIMALSARTLVQLPPELREGYRERLAEGYALRLSQEPPVPDSQPYFFPYIGSLKAALAERLGHPVDVVTSLTDGDLWFWAPMDTGDGVVWSGFPRERLRTRPLEGLAAITGVALMLTLLTAALLARRVTQPLQRLSAAAAEVAQGHSPNPLPVTGPAELARLAAQFNEMSRQVWELLANRTVLLAGISHDLRTPLTRLRLAIAMLPSDAPADLISRMERDIEEMDAMISQSVDFGRNLGAGQPEDVDLAQLIGDLVSDRPRVIWQLPPPCPYRVDALALRRILGNLLENALRYSRDAVEVYLDCRPPSPSIYVLDRGPGIPEAEREAVFRPYYRLEKSRSRKTGGSGLGLAVARQLAVANRMQLHLGVRGGGGTVARVELPPYGTAVLPDEEPAPSDGLGGGPEPAPGRPEPPGRGAVDGRSGAA